MEQKNHLNAKAIAHPNIALIKYWGNVNEQEHIPSSGSISLNLNGLFTEAQVVFSKDFNRDSLILNGIEVHGESLARVSQFLDHLRKAAGQEIYAQVITSNNFPAGVGIASSASAFAALAVAASSALHLDLSEKELSRLARLGSGSACRSIPAGFVEWFPGDSDGNSFAVSFAPPDHWNLVDCIAVFSVDPKPVSSLQGHMLAHTSPLQTARIADAPRRLNLCRDAILKKDFDALADVVEQDSNLMHAIMMTSVPPIFYWEPVSLNLIKWIPSWRKAGLSVCYTLDAGPNVHILTTASCVAEVQQKLQQIPGLLKVFVAGIGNSARII